MATNATELQKYFADMDAAEEADAAAAGLAPDELRRSRLEPEYVKENRRASRVATEEAARTGEAPRDVLYDTDRMAALEKARTQRVPPSMATPLEFARPINTQGSAVGLEQTGRLLRSRLDLPETVPSLSMPSGVPAKTTDFASLQKLMSPGALKAPEAQSIPVASVPTKADVPAVAASALAPTGPENPAPPAGTSSTVKPPPVDAGSGGDDALDRLSIGQALTRALEGSGSIIAGQNLRSGAADTLGDRMKQIEALRAKKVERQEGLDLERSQNEQTLNAYQAQFPELRETLEPLRGQTGKPVFPSLLRDIVATRKAKTGERALDLREQGMQDTVEFRTGTLGLRKDTLEEKKRYNDIQAGLKQAELNLRAAENERKATGSAEPTEKERSAFQTSMKPAENTAVSLKDADNLNSLSTGMLVSGKPPPFLTQSDILSFVGIPPFEGAMRSRLAQSNPQAFDLLTQMARLKTMVGHEYFGSALSPAEAERQRQFLDFGVTDTPESIARKMKSYHDSLADKASIFLRPRVLGRPLGNEWAQATGLDALSAPGGTFAGLLEAPKNAAPRVAPAPAGAGSEGKVRMLSPDNRTARIPAAEVEARKAQGWKEAP